MISSLHNWEEHEDYYFDSLIPDLMEKPTIGGTPELRVAMARLKEYLSESSWGELPVILRKYKRGRLQVITPSVLWKEKAKQSTDDLKIVKQKFKSQEKSEAERKEKGGKTPDHHRTQSVRHPRILRGLPCRALNSL